MSGDTGMEWATVAEEEQEIVESKPSPKFAFGVVADDSDVGAVTRSIVRAKKWGLGPILIHREPDSTDLSDIAAELNVTELEVDDTSLDKGGLVAQLVGAAKSRGFRGIIVQEPPLRRVDFAESIAKLTNTGTYAVEAIPSGQSVKPDLIVGIPAHNQADSIVEVVSDTAWVADEVIVVDDGSDDETASLAEEAGATVIAFDYQHGYGKILRVLAQAAKDREAGNLAVIDASGVYDPGDIPAAIDALSDSGEEIMLGSRYRAAEERDEPVARGIIWHYKTAIRNLSLGFIRPRHWISDTKSGFWVFSKAAIEGIAGEAGRSLAHTTTTSDIVYELRREGFGIGEVGVGFEATESPEGYGGGNHSSLTGHILRTITRSFPMRIIGAPGVVSFGIGLGFAAWTIQNYVQTGTFPKGLAIVASFFGLVGVLGVGIALILQAQKRAIERQ